MKSLLPWLFMMSAPAFAADPPQIVWPKSAVTVVFAPDRREPAQPVEFVARGGVIGIRPGPESAIATVVTIGDDGKRRVQCARFPEALESLKPSSSRAPLVNKEAGSDK